ncbi:plasmid partitioning protein RepA, partial [Sinorhizobium medicae]
GTDVLTATVLKSTSIADAGLTKQTLYEIEKGQVRKSTYDRALESVNAANGEVLAEVHRTWGRV